MEAFSVCKCFSAVLKAHKMILFGEVWKARQLLQNSNSQRHQTLVVQTQPLTSVLEAQHPTLSVELSKVEQVLPVRKSQSQDLKPVEQGSCSYPALLGLQSCHYPSLRKLCSRLVLLPSY